MAIGSGQAPSSAESMWRIIGALLLVGLIVVAVKVAILLLFLAGLIFRTKETIGLIAILAVFALLAKYPVAGFALIGVLVLIAIIRAAKSS